MFRFRARYRRPRERPRTASGHFRRTILNGSFGAGCGPVGGLDQCGGRVIAVGAAEVVKRGQGAAGSHLKDRAASTALTGLTALRPTAAPYPRAYDNTNAILTVPRRCIPDSRRPRTATGLFITVLSYGNVQSWQRSSWKSPSASQSANASDSPSASRWWSRRSSEPVEAPVAESDAILVMFIESVHAKLLSNQTPGA